MPKYLARASYTSEGLAGLMKEGGTSRRDALSATIASVGGTVEAFYYAFGEDDLYIIMDVPDQAAAAALGLAISAAGAITWSTTALLTPEEIDAAVGTPVEYRPPGA